MPSPTKPSSDRMLEAALADFCTAFDSGEIIPLLEADVTAYLYHRLVSHGCPLSDLFMETRVCGIQNRKYDLVIGTLNTAAKRACVEPLLIAEVKCFQRWGMTPQQHHRRFQGIREEDVPALLEAKAASPKWRIEVAVDLWLSSQALGYLSGRWNSQVRSQLIKTDCQNAGVGFWWIHPNQHGSLQISKLA